MSSVVSQPSQEDTCSMLLFCLKKNVPPDEDATDYVFHAVGNLSYKRVWPNQNIISSEYQKFNSSYVGTGYVSYDNRETSRLSFNDSFP